MTESVYVTLYIGHIKGDTTHGCLKFDKTPRILGIYSKLINGYVINKAEEAVNYGVNERSIQRDIDDIRNFVDSDPSMQGMMNSVIYD